VRQYILRERGESLPPSPLSVKGKQEGDYFHEKLFLCGSAWEHYRFTDMEGNPWFFRYGFTKKPEFPDEKTVGKYGKQLFSVWEQCIAEGDDWAEESLYSQLLSHLSHHENLNNVKERRKKIERKTSESERERQKLIRLRRQKQTVRRYTNLNKLHFMYGLTFALKKNEKVKGLRFVLSREEQKDRESVERAWNIRRGNIRKYCERKGRDFKYIKILERHDGERTSEEKRGTFHIHLASDRPFPKSKLQELWGYGTVWIDDFNKSKKRVNGETITGKRKSPVADPGRYLAKYIDKDFEEHGKEPYKRAFSPSKNLRKPIPIRDSYAIRRVLNNPAKHLDTETLIELKKMGIDTRDISNEEIWSKCLTYQSEFEVSFPVEGPSGPEMRHLKVHYATWNMRKLAID